MADTPSMRSSTKKRENPGPAPKTRFAPRATPLMHYVSNWSTTYAPLIDRGSRLLVLAYPREIVFMSS
jgi:hypothetical protein